MFGRWMGARYRIMSCTFCFLLEAETLTAQIFFTHAMRNFLVSRIAGSRVTTASS
jgi:hypothetical protein